MINYGFGDMGTALGKKTRYRHDGVTSPLQPMPQPMLSSSRRGQSCRADTARSRTWFGTKPGLIPPTGLCHDSLIKCETRVWHN